MTRWCRKHFPTAPGGYRIFLPEAPNVVDDCSFICGQRVPACCVHCFAASDALAEVCLPGSMSLSCNNVSASLHFTPLRIVLTACKRMPVHERNEKRSCGTRDRKYCYQPVHDCRVMPGVGGWENRQENLHICIVLLLPALSEICDMKSFIFQPMVSCLRMPDQFWKSFFAILLQSDISLHRCGLHCQAIWQRKHLELC